MGTEPEFMCHNVSRAPALSAYGQAVYVELYSVD